MVDKKASCGAIVRAAARALEMGAKVPVDPLEEIAKKSFALWHGAAASSVDDVWERVGSATRQRWIETVRFILENAP